MKYSKQARERAAMICAIAASADPYAYGVASRTYIGIAKGLDLASDSFRPHMRLAHAAWRVTVDSYGDWTSASDAEAEAMLRCGWSPP